MDFKHADLARPFYEEALALYRQDEQSPPLDLANALRSMAVLKDHAGDIAGGAPLWREARELYLSVNVPAGVAECDRQRTNHV